MLWAPVPTRVWLNALEAMREAGALSRQLIAAHAAGFTTPRTVVSNDWSRVLALAGEQAIAFKTLVGRVETANEVGRDIFTTRLTTGSLGAHRSHGAIPYPGIAQPFVEKKREWRVTVVDEDVFSAAIETDGSAKVDWRREYHTPHVRFSSEELPPSVTARCRSTVQQLGLRYAGNDLIETAEGEFVFLEANPNGQYLWLEEELGLPISDAVASALVKTVHTAGTLPR